jgi:hypothetical protein
MDATHAEELLRKMERQILDQLGANEMAQEPEREIHSDEAFRGERQRDLQERLNEISSLRDLFTQQSHTIALLKQPQPSSCDLPPVGGTLTLQPTEVSDYTDFSSNSLADNGDLQEKSDTPYVTPTKTLEETLEEITNKLDESLRDTLNETSPTSVLQFDSRLHKDDIAHSAYQEDDDSFQLDFDGTDSEIQDAINEIRKEASRMDILMALDQVHTVQSELSLVTKALQERSTEAEDLRLQLEESEERMSCLELERDLFKADASKVRDDLETCVARMFDISLVAGQSYLEPDVTRDRPAERQSQEAFRKNEESSSGLKANGRSQKTPKAPVMLKASKRPQPMHSPMTRLAEENEDAHTPSLASIQIKAARSFEDEPTAVTPVEEAEQPELNCDHQCQPLFILIIFFVKDISGRYLTLFGQLPEHKHQSRDVAANQTRPKTDILNLSRRRKKIECAESSEGDITTGNRHQRSKILPL